MASQFYICIICLGPVVSKVKQKAGQSDDSQGSTLFIFKQHIVRKSEQQCE